MTFVGLHDAAGPHQRHRLSAQPGLDRCRSRRPIRAAAAPPRRRAGAAAAAPARRPRRRPGGAQRKKDWDRGARRRSSSPGRRISARSSGCPSAAAELQPPVPRSARPRRRGARASARGSTATALWWALAWMMRASSTIRPTWPSQNTRSPRRRPWARSSPRRAGRLQVGVARAAAAAGVERLLHQARAVEPQALAPAPLVGRAEIALGHGDRIALEGVERARDAAAAIQPVRATGRSRPRSAPRSPARSA